MDKEAHRLHLFLVLERLLEITLVRGIEEAVSIFDRCSRPEGAHGVFQDVRLLSGIKLKTEAQVFEGVRLVPLPSSEASEELTLYLPGFPTYAFIDESADFFNKTLLVIDRPGISIFHKPSPELLIFPQGHPVDNLPFQVDVHDVKFPNTKAVHSFLNLFYKALSLACNSPVQVVRGGWFLEEDKSFNPHQGIINGFRDPNLFGSSVEVREADIEKAICLYEILGNLLNELDSKVGEKLQISIDRWARSKASISYVDQIIDLGIAFEVLYVPDGGSGEITFKLAVRAAWHLGKDKGDRKQLLTKFKDIYKYRSNAVHNGQLDETIRFGGERIHRSEFIAEIQDLCRRSIMKILEDNQFPEWDNVVLDGKVEQASS